MRLANTIGFFSKHTNSPAEAVRLFEGSGFVHLDFNFYNFAKKGHPFLTDRWMEQIAEAKDVADALGFDFVQAHAPNYNFLSPKADHEAGMLSTIRSIEACDYLGIRNMVIHLGFGDNILYPNGKVAYFRRNIAWLQQFIPHLEKHNVNLLVENSAEKNMGRRYFLMEAQEMVDFITEFDHPLVQVGWDVGHANMRGTNPYADIITLGPHLKALHIQDNFGTYDEHISPYMGTLDLDAVMQGLMDTGYDGYFTFEADEMLAFSGGWPHPRRNFSLPHDRKLSDPSLELTRQANALLYQIGKHILTQYGMFED